MTFNYELSNHWECYNKNKFLAVADDGRSLRPFSQKYRIVPEKTYKVQK